MPETEEEKEKRLLRELEGKNISHYSILLGAWISTKMERDRSLVTLSTAAIGLMVTILTTIGVASLYLLVLFVFGFLGFGICIWKSIQIYQLNSTHLENELRNESDSSLKLEKYDKRSLRPFLVGVFCICLIGIFSAYLKFDTEDKVMSNENSQTTSSSTEKKSLDGIQNLRPENTQKPSSSENSGQSNQSSGESNDKKG